MREIEPLHAENISLKDIAQSRSGELIFSSEANNVPKITYYYLLPTPLLWFSV